MSEVFDGGDALRRALESEAFRRWLGDLDAFELWAEAPCADRHTTNVRRELITMTQQDDDKRRQVLDALDKWKFKNSRMRGFAAGSSIDLDEVLSCAKEIITSTDASSHDKPGAADIIVIIGDWQISDDD